MYDNFVIQLEGLKIGEHRFKFLLDTTFFESLDYSLIEKGKVEVHFLLKKKERLCEITARFIGKLDCICDRCGGDLEFPVDFREETVLKYGNEEISDDGIWMILEENSDELDTTHYLYETLCLALPSKMVHNEEDGTGECDEELLDQLDEYAGNGSDDDEDKIDPRWEALNKLK